MEDACHPAVILIAGRFVPPQGQHMKKRGVGQGPFFFDGIGGKHQRGYRLQAPEDRSSNRRPAGLCAFDLDWRDCSFDFDWQGRPVALPLVTPQGLWLRKPGWGGRCTTVLEESDGR